MARQVVTCQAEDDLQMVLDAMDEHQLRRIPIMGNDGRIIGIIAQADVAKRVNQLKKLPQWLRKFSSPTRSKKKRF